MSVIYIDIIVSIKAFIYLFCIYSFFYSFLGLNELVNEKNERQNNPLSSKTGVDGLIQALLNAVSTCD